MVTKCPPDKILNPITNRCNKIKNIKNIKKICEPGKILNPITNRCNKIILIPECPEGKYRNPITNRCKKIALKIINSNVNIDKSEINDIFKNKSLTSLEKLTKLKKIWKVVKIESARTKAAKKIVKYVLPYITSTFNIKNRIKYAKEIINYIADIKSSGETLQIIEKDKYEIANGKLKLLNCIGTPSLNGAIYTVKLLNNSKLYKVAAKIFRINKNNTSEINILTILTDIVIQNKNPHFPIMYKNFKMIKQNNKKNVNYPSVINNYDNFFYVNLNEEFTGDLKMFLRKKQTYEIYKNTLEQVFIALLSFHKFTGLAHADAHWGNFLYHKIKPGGYIHYNIFNVDIYVENLGYLWIIWDYGYSNINDNKLVDFFRILNAFIYVYEGGWQTRKFYDADLMKLTLHIKDSFQYIKKNINYPSNKDLFNKIINDSQNINFLSNNKKPADVNIINLNNPYKI